MGWNMVMIATVFLILLAATALYPILYLALSNLMKLLGH